MIGRPREALRPEPRRLSSWSRAALCPSGCSVKSPLMPKKERFGNRGKWFAACLSQIVRERPGRVLRLGRRGRPPLPNRLIFGEARNGDKGAARNRASSCTAGFCQARQSTVVPGRVPSCTTGFFCVRQGPSRRGRRSRPSETKVRPAPNQSRAVRPTAGRRPACHRRAVLDVLRYPRPVTHPACQGRRFSGILHDLCKRSFSMERRETP